MFTVSFNSINGNGNTTYNVYRNGSGMYQHFVATVEIRDDAPLGLKVLYGALQPKGKQLVWDAINAYAERA
jgi:hypothetical protein